MEACFSGAINSAAFASSLSHGSLPKSDDITYGGAFNELLFEAGAKATEPLELHIGYCRGQNQASAFDSGVHDYLALFTKGAKDGRDRDGRNMNAVVCLDTSGSMSCNLSAKCYDERIVLAKEAINMFISKLRPNDRFGLVQFSSESAVMVDLCSIGEETRTLVSEVVNTMEVGGGTDLASAVNCASQMLFKHEVPANAENRIIMVTDVCDSCFLNERARIEALAEKGIYMTIVGVSEEFRSDLCENLKDIKGFNYFCAVEAGDLRRYLFENFSFTFFPSSHDVEISIESDQIASFEVFGSSDPEKVLGYNDHFREPKPFVVTRTKSSFPSELELDMAGNVRMYGGLLLLKLKLREPSTRFAGKVTLKCKSVTESGEVPHSKEYPISFEGPLHEQFFTQESLRQAYAAFEYVFEAKNVVESINADSKRDVAKFLTALKALEGNVPKGKADELKKLMKLVEERKGANPETEPSLERVK